MMPKLRLRNWHALLIIAVSFAIAGFVWADVQADAHAARQAKHERCFQASLSHGAKAAFNRCMR